MGGAGQDKEGCVEPCPRLSGVPDSGPVPAQLPDAILPHLPSCLRTVTWAGCFLGLCRGHVQAKSAQPADRQQAGGQAAPVPLLLLCPCECRLETPQVTRRTATCRRASGSARPGGERVRAGEKQRTQCLLCACWLPGALQVSVPSSSQQKGIGVVIFYPTLQRQQRG